MARANSSGIFKFLAAGVGVIVLGIGAGYLAGGGLHPARSGPVAPPVDQQPPPPPPAPVVSRKPPAVPRRTNSDYTAPGAPRIHIVEEKTPSLTNATSQTRTAAKTDSDTSATVTDIPTPDVEASQAGDSAAQPSGQSSDQPSDSAPVPKTRRSPAASSSDNSPPPPPLDTGPDYERVGNRSDAESSQTGSGVTGDSRTTFRVQTGSFDEAQNARALADSLRDRGYSVSTHAERDGGRTVYKVQVGAYRTRAAADKAAQDFQQRSGYPAYVSPSSP